VDVDHLESIGSDSTKCVRRAEWRYDDISSRRLDGLRAEDRAARYTFDRPEADAPATMWPSRMDRSGGSQPPGGPAVRAAKR
jgi:hypothetical protein